MISHVFRRVRAIAVAVIGAAALIGAVGEALPAAAATPELSVTITDGHKTVESGEAVTYSTEVKNLGTDPLIAKVVVTVPGYVTAHAPDGGTVDKQDTTWAITVDPGKTATVKLSGKIGTIPKSEVRVTAVASVYVDGAKPSPLVRSADASRIAGVADTPPPASTEKASSKASSAAGWIIGGIIAAVVAIAAIAFALILIRRRSHRQR